jgi:DNA repair photolyase
MKTFKGKAIYQPAGKAAEYAKWACNFYVGCSNGCTYCYLKKGVLAHAMGQDKPQLKKCFKDEQHALEVFGDELILNLSEIRKHGLFFSFTTDPMLPECSDLTWNALNLCREINVPCKVLTKCVTGKILNIINYARVAPWWRHNVALGFTLTGHDELEPGASTNAERIQAMKELHDAGFKTFASIEPIIDFESSLQMIKQASPYCDLFKIGLESGGKYNKQEAVDFVLDVVCINRGSKYYFKDSIVKLTGLGRNTQAPFDHIVDRDYNLFK